MAEVIRPMDDKDRTPLRAGRGSSGLWVSAPYLVNTGSVLEALNARGLPREGEAYDSSYPACVATEFNWEPWSQKDGADLTGGAGIVRVEFREPGPGRALPASENDAWTDLEVSADTVTVTRSLERLVHGNLDVNAYPIANGDGVNVKQAAFQATIYTFHRADWQIDLQRLVSLGRPTCKVNDRALSLPRLWHTMAPIPLDKGMVLYLGVEKPEKVGQLIKVAHRVAIASDWNARWFPLDSDSNVNPTYLEPVEDRVYEEADFSGLWPGA